MRGIKCVDCMDRRNRQSSVMAMPLRNFLEAGIRVHWVRLVTNICKIFFFQSQLCLHSVGTWLIEERLSWRGSGDISAFCSWKLMPNFMTTDYDTSNNFKPCK